MANIKNCKCGVIPVVVEVGTYQRASCGGLSKTSKKRSFVHIECTHCGTKPFFKSVDRKTAIATWNEGLTAKNTKSTKKGTA
jgi:hypothetical protein